MKPTSNNFPRSFLVLGIGSLLFLGSLTTAEDYDTANQRCGDSSRSTAEYESCMEAAGYPVVDACGPGGSLYEGCQGGTSAEVRQCLISVNCISGDDVGSQTGVDDEPGGDGSQTGVDDGEGEDDEPGGGDTPPGTDPDGSRPGGRSISADIELKNPIEARTIEQLILTVVRLLIQLAIPIAVLFIIWSGLKFILARGNEKKLEDAKSMLLWTIVGLAVLLGAMVIAEIVKNTITSLG